MCVKHSVLIKAAALQFSLAHPAAAAIIPGASNPDRIKEDHTVGAVERQRCVTFARHNEAPPAAGLPSTTESSGTERERTILRQLMIVQLVSLLTANQQTVSRQCRKCRLSHNCRCEQLQQIHARQWSGLGVLIVRNRAHHWGFTLMSACTVGGTRAASLITNFPWADTQGSARQLRRGRQGAAA